MFSDVETHSKRKQMKASFSFPFSIPLSLQHLHLQITMQVIQHCTPLWVALPTQTPRFANLQILQLHPCHFSPMSAVPSSSALLLPCSRSRAACASSCLHTRSSAHTGIFPADKASLVRANVTHSPPLQGGVNCFQWDGQHGMVASRELGLWEAKKQNASG